MGSTVEAWLPPGAGNEEVDAALGALDRAGAVAFELAERDGRQVVLALLGLADPEAARRAALGAFAEAGLGGAEARARPAETLDWGSTWRESVRPIRVGALWIVPEGVSAPDPDAPVLRIAAGEAFGSGLHATTRMCLDRLAEGPRSRSLLDVGTGTGILALAALRLGWDRVVATDTDPAAREAAGRNAAANGLAGAIEVTAGLPPPGVLFDQVVANLLAAPLVDLAAEVVRRVGPAGEVVLSGVRSGQAVEVAGAYRDLGLRQVGTDERDGWVRLDFAASW